MAGPATTLRERRRSKPPTYMSDRVIGSAVAAEVARAGLRHQDVAEEIGLDPASFSRSVAGNRQWKATEIQQIARCLGIGVDVLLDAAPTHGGNPTGGDPTHREPGGGTVIPLTRDDATLCTLVA